jgi:hypothetical protein
MARAHVGQEYMASNQATKIKMPGGFKQSCNTNTNKTALVNCYPLLIQKNPMRHQHSSCPFSFARCSIEKTLSHCVSYWQCLIDHGHGSHPTRVWHPTKPQRQHCVAGYSNPATLTLTVNCYPFLIQRQNPMRYKPFHLRETATKKQSPCISCR